MMKTTHTERSKTPEVLKAARLHAVIESTESLKQLGNWIDGQLEQLEARFHQFQTPKSQRQSLGR